jgi:hypothetical protein
MIGDKPRVATWRVAFRDGTSVPMPAESVEAVTRSGEASFVFKGGGPVVAVRAAAVLSITVEPAE